MDHQKIELDKVEMATEDGQPIVAVCPANECGSLNPWIMECAGGLTWVVVCDEGHMSFLWKITGHDAP